MLDRHAQIPLRVRVAAAAVPTLLSAVVFAAEPSWRTVGWLVVALLPWLLEVVNWCPRWPYVGVLPVGAVAALMSQWRTTDLSLMLLVYFIGQSAVLHPPRLSGAVVVVCVAVPVGWQLGSAYGHMGAWIIGMVMAWLSGAALRAQQLTVVRLREAQEELATKAVADERRRIAREVHDLAAHSMAVTMLHLTGARLALADGEVAEAESALAAAERLGRSSLDEIRRAVGALADPADVASRKPEPSARDVSALVEDYRRAGMPVGFTERGAPVDSDAVLGLTLYRLVQESLANAARHAPGAPVRVTVEWTADVVALEVVNPLPPGPRGDGHGLLGMGERVALLGGEFASGPVAEEWQVRASLPCHAPSLEPQ